jgi:hypothetical protein
MRTPLEGLASQTLVEVTTERAAYVGKDLGSEPLETTPTVLVFSASRLSIENPFQLRSTRAMSLQNLIGLRVVDAYSTEEDLVVLFEGDVRLAVSLREKDFTTPEAAVFAPSRGPIVVFN